jgi:hypothetical protein
MTMKSRYKKQTRAVNYYIKNIMIKILETYNGTMYFK